MSVIAPPRTATFPHIDGLEITRLIARGGQASVYHGVQRDHGREVAIKVVDCQALDEDILRRFQRERLGLGRISNHPSIISLHDSGFTDDGCPYLVLEYAAGGTLADRLAHGPLGTDEATRISIELGEALEHAHRQGVLHRDMKPENVLHSLVGGWKLADFGLALSMADGDATDTIQVSLAHAAPELLNGDDASTRSEVYALASVLLTLLTGREPFGVSGSEPMISAMHRLMTDDVPDARLDGVPAEIANVIEIGMAKDPANRYGTARAFVQAVRAARRSLGLAVAPSTDSGATRVVSENSTDSLRSRSKHKVRGMVGRVGAVIALVATLIGVVSMLQLTESASLVDVATPAESADIVVATDQEEVQPRSNLTEPTPPTVESERTDEAIVELDEAVAEEPVVSQPELVVTLAGSTTDADAQTAGLAPVALDETVEAQAPTGPPAPAGGPGGGPDGGGAGGGGGGGAGPDGGGGGGQGGGGGGPDGGGRGGGGGGGDRP